MRIVSKRILAVAVLGLLALIVAVPMAEAQQGKGKGKRGKEHHFHGKVVAVDVDGKGIGTVTVQIHEHKKKGQVSKGKQTERITFNVNRATKIEIVRNGRATRGNLADIHRNDHVAIAAHGHHADRIVDGHKKGKKVA
jgi:hypothetical protein